jgi:hypothetical protein
LLGFVEELAVADDPEFESWSLGGGGPDSISLDAASVRGGGGALRPASSGGGGGISSGHERRQTLLFLLDARVRRRMARTVLEMGGNAVLGYHQNFDMEGDSGIVRAGVLFG